MYGPSREMYYLGFRNLCICENDIFMNIGSVPRHIVLTLTEQKNLHNQFYIRNRKKCDLFYFHVPMNMTNTCSQFKKDIFFPFFTYMMIFLNMKALKV